MQDFWITFMTGAPGCVTAENAEAAKEEAKRITGRVVATWYTLPYPAEPRLNKVEIKGYGVCPSFCFAPEKCKGRTSCPQRHSCVD